MTENPLDALPSEGYAAAQRAMGHMERIREAEERLGVTLSARQAQCALAYLTVNDFMSSGRGAGKTFLIEFMKDSGLVTEEFNG